jgi:ribulose-phosphate 3-epimerase
MTRYRYSSVFLTGVAVFTGASNALTLGSNKNIIVAPSVAKADFLNLGRDLSEAVAGGAEWLHFSVQDGRMVPKISFGTPLVATCRDAFPDTVFDVKLGCIEPEHRISDFVKAGADILSVHPESTLQLGAVINIIEKAGVAPGVILNPGTPVSAVQHVLDQCQVAVVMLVNPGYGGPKYLDLACDKIKTLRQLKPDLHVSVDGGVSERNAAQLIAAGANVLIAGGGVFKAEDKRAAIAKLKYPAYAKGS